MTKRYVTMGQAHIHRINGKVIDKDCVVVLHGTRERVFELFGPKFCFEYTEEQWNDAGMPDKMHYFPRGYIEL